MNGSLKNIDMSFGELASRAPAGGSERIRNECADAAAGAASVTTARIATTVMARSGERLVLISYRAIVGKAMLSGLLIALVVLSALACPVMMLLGRRGIGPGCAMMGCKPRQPNNPDSIRARQRDLATEIEKLEARQVDTLAS
jgi:hypothetical protein